MADGIADLLRCPVSGAEMRLRNDAYVSLADEQIRFPVEQEIVRAFLEHEFASVDVTERMQQFYEQNPFPNYDGMDDLGSLIERSRSRGFPEMLNRSIAPAADVLEVGCGTGQLGNFLGIAGRRVLSADLCLNSLRLGQAFKQKHALESVTFAQMNLFRLPLRPAAFDVVICTGVLHHTSNPQRGLRGIVPLAKPGGHVIVGLYNRYGRLKTRLRRGLSRLLGDRIVRFDPYVRDWGVKEEKRRSWYMDQYRNPHESLHTFDEVLDWFERTGLRFVRSFPSTVFGATFEPDYRRTIFDEEPRGSAVDRLASQLGQMLTDDEGGLFVMIGRRE